MFNKSSLAKQFSKAMYVHIIYGHPSAVLTEVPLYVELINVIYACLKVQA